MINPSTLMITEWGREKMSEIGSSVSTHAEDDKWKRLVELEKQVEVANCKLELQEKLRSATTAANEQTLAAIQTTVQVLQQSNIGLMSCYHQLQGEINEGGVTRPKGR